MNADDSAAALLYPAQVMHRRCIAPRYRFSYRVFYLLLDVDRLDASAARLRWFSHNRFNLLALHDADHGHGVRGGLRAWAEAVLRGAGIDERVGRIRLLCMPRLLGYAFNPISLWFCDDGDGRPRAVIAEVRNTFGERHAYLLASGPGAAAYACGTTKDKCFHVSPFFDLAGQYRFQIAAPGARLRVQIRKLRDGAAEIDTSLSGTRVALTDAAILRQTLAMPWMTLKVVAAIHWEALRLWWRGASFHRKPPPPAHEVT